MKNKVLLSTLLGSALLVGCTADDALDVRKNVAERVNPTAPVFTVSFGDDLTRASMATDGVNGIKWAYDDKMSLYHGGGDMPTAGEWNVKKFTDNDNFLKSPLQVRQFNAIYSIDEDNGEGQPVFATSSMVNEGLAIMVYPADTTHSQVHQNPYIYLDIDQNENTKNKTPHVSEVMKIEPYNADKAHSAGYGRNYDVRMRQIGAQLRLKLDGKDAQVDDIEFRRVKIEVADADHSPFTVISEVKVGQLRRDAETGEGSSEVGKNTEQYNHYMYTPWIEPAEDGKSEYISTTDIENNETAVFTLLPYDDRTDNGGETYKSAFNESGETLFGNVTITVETNYGKVVLEEDGKSMLWSNSKGEAKSTMTNGLAAFLKAVFEPQTKGNELYSGQYLGKGGTRILTVDLSKLDMNGLHVKNEDELMKVLDVYDGLNITEPVTFILDGAEEGEYKGKFGITKTNWGELEKRLAKTNNKVSFALCTEEAPCKAIVLDNNKGDKAIAEIPELKFVKLNDKGEVDATQSADVTVELLGTWQYASVEKDPTVAANKDAAKVLVGIKELVVKNSLTLSGFIASTDGTEDYNSKTNGVEIVVEQQADVTVSGKVVLQENMTNHGAITIPENTSLSVANGKTLVNREAPGLNATAWDNQDVEGTSGKIYNSGTLAIVDANPGSINNYGVIKIEKDAARTLISANADINASGDALSLADDFINVEQAEKKGGSTKPQRIGSIFLANKDGGTTGMKFTDVNNEEAQGFIKLVISDNKEICETNTGIANYIIVTGNTAGICTTSDKKGIVDYLEVRTTTPILMGAKANVSLKGLLVPETNYSVNVPTGTKLTVTEALYLKGSITKVGAITNSTFVYDGAKFKGYFGGDEADINNIYTSK